MAMARCGGGPILSCSFRAANIPLKAEKSDTNGVRKVSVSEVGKGPAILKHIWSRTQRVLSL